MKEEKELKLKAQLQREKEEFEEKKKNIIVKIQSRREKIKLSKEEMKKETQKRVRRSPLHSKLVNKFKETHVIPELEKRKQVLSQIRNLHQPIRLTNIREHSENKKQLLKEKMKEFFSRRADYATAAMDHNDKYNSYFWKEVERREKEERDQKRANMFSVKDRHQKSIDYAKNAMELYKPTISNKKKLEMELIKKNLDDPHSFSKRKGIQSVKMGQNKSMMSPTNKELSTEVSSPLRRSIRKLAKPKPLDDKRYSYHPIPHDRGSFVKHDYLRQMRLLKVKFCIHK